MNFTNIYNNSTQLLQKLYKPIHNSTTLANTLQHKLEHLYTNSTKNKTLHNLCELYTFCTNNFQTNIFSFTKKREKQITTLQNLSQLQKIYTSVQTIQNVTKLDNSLHIPTHIVIQSNITMCVFQIFFTQLYKPLQILTILYNTIQIYKNLQIVQNVINM